MVGEAVVTFPCHFNVLRKGAGTMYALNNNGNFGASPHRGKVYFIKCRDAIKIGFSLNPGMRLGELQVGSVDEMELVSRV